MFLGPVYKHVVLTLLILGLGCPITRVTLTPGLPEISSKRTDCLSLFAYGLEIWGSASKKYLDRIDNFCKRAYRYGYTAKADFEISTLIEERDKLLFNKITTMKDHPLQDLLPPKRSRMLRKRGHKFQLPQIRTERYKNSFMNRCLFKFV